MFGMPFGKEIDMWSLGCILAELYLSKPLFMGNSKIDIMKKVRKKAGQILDLLSPPTHLRNMKCNLVAENMQFDVESKLS